MLRTSLRFAWRGLNHLTRIVVVAAVMLTLGCGALMLGLRYWILPDIERYHGVITVSLSQSIGQPVSIGKIEADWRGIRAHLLLSDVRILDKNKSGATALALQHVDSVVSWMTLLRGEIRLYSLELDQPDLLIRRDLQGMLHIAGVALTSQSSDKNDFADWLLHQTVIVIREARITWLDELDGSPPLVFNQLNLLIENRRRHHRFALRAVPPPALSAQIDVRGDFTGRSLDDLKAWRGELYTQLDYADVAAWRAWLPMPAGFQRGRGALRGWLTIADGKVNQVTTDLALADVRAQLGAGLSPLDLRSLSGRIAWMDTAQTTEIATHQLSLKAGTVVVQPTDFLLRLSQASGNKLATGEVSANTLELANLVTLTDALPLSKLLKKQLAELVPQGTVSDLHVTWQGDADKPVHYEVKTRFDQLSLKRTGKLPGFSGLSGDLDGSEVTGTLTLNSRKMTLDAPQIMPESLAFEKFAGKGSWRADKQGVEVKFSDITAANDDLAGSMYGSFKTLPNSPGVINLNINLTRAAVGHADRYIPLAALNKETHDWLHNALLGGHADEFHLRLNGDLNEFPFAENKKGIFQIQARAKGVKLQYDKDWPLIDNITGELLILGKRLETNASSGSTLGAHLQKVSVVIPDLVSNDLLLQVRGDALGETSRSLDFIQRSPVRGYIDGFTDNMTARGNGNLHLAVDVPLHGDKPVKVAGSYQFTNNELNLGEGVPLLRSATGELVFTESTLHTNNVSAQILGGPATLTLQSNADGSILSKVHGRADMESLRKIVIHPSLSYLHGGCDWDAEITLQKKLVNVLVTSNLSGLAADLPAPFTKAAGEVVPSRFEMKDIAANQDVISLQYGKLLDAKLFRREEGSDRVIQRGWVNFGGAGKLQSRDGVWITGTVPHLALEGWGGLLGSSNNQAAADGKVPAGANLAINVAGADLSILKVDAMGLNVNSLRVNARNQDGVFSAQLASKEINGDLSWQPEGKGRLVARLRNLTLSGGQSGLVAGSKPEETTRQAVAGDASTITEFPALDLVVDDIIWKDKKLGKLELLARQHGRDWLLEHARITNPDGVLTADGKYHIAEGKKQTQVNLKLEIGNAGKILTHAGFPDSVKNGSGKLEGEFSWPGAPDDFAYAALDGMLSLETGKGQFLKVDQGAAKLLGILSLQALPKHITLDFTDVFSDGFAFDTITGTALINKGIMETHDFRIDGSSAKVTMLGQVDLNRETLNLRVRILPTVGNSVSLLSAFAAGPMVGIGTFIVNKILREPLDKMVLPEYNVTGTWTDPSFVKMKQQQVNKPLEFN